MKGGNCSQSQKMAGQKGWSQAKAMQGVMRDDGGWGLEGAPDVGTRTPHFQFTSKGHGIWQCQMVIWVAPHGCFPPRAPTPTPQLGKAPALLGPVGSGRPEFFFFFVSNVDKLRLEVSLRNQTSLPKYRDNCKRNTLVNCVPFYILSCSV